MSGVPCFYNELQRYFVWQGKVVIGQDTSFAFGVELNDHFDGCAFSELL